MTLFGWIQILLFCAIVLALVLVYTRALGTEDLV